MDVLAVIPHDARLEPGEVDALLEIAYFTTAANGDLSDEEVDAYRVAAQRLREMAGAPRRGPLADREIEGEIDAFEAHLRHASMEARLGELAASLPSVAARERAYALSYAFSLCDWETNEDERRFLALLAAATELPADRVRVIEDAAHAKLGL